MEIGQEPATLPLPQKHTEDSQIIQLSAEEARRKRNRLAQRKHRLRVKSVGGESTKNITDTSQDTSGSKSLPQGTLAAQLPSGNVNDNASQPHTQPTSVTTISASSVTSVVSALGSAAQDSLLVTTDTITSPGQQPMHDTSSLSFNIGELNGSELPLVCNLDIASLNTVTLYPIDQTLPDFHSQLDEFLNDMTDLDDSRPLYDRSQALQCEHPLTPVSKDMEGDVQMSNGPTAKISTRNLTMSTPNLNQAEIRFNEAVSWDEGNDIESDYGENVSDLDRCFERIIEVVEEAGFTSIDEMSATYYTARFAEDSVSYEAQSRSRSRLLQSFLQSVHTSTEHWSSREVQGYRHQIVAAAETVYMDEIVEARQAQLARKGQVKISSKVGGEENRTETAQDLQTSNARRVQKIWEAIAELDLESDMKNKRRQYRDKMPETWSLLCQLSRKAGLHGPQATQIILAFLTLLFESNPQMLTGTSRPTALGRRLTVA